MAIVFVVPGTLWLKFVIAYAVSQIILLVRTVFEKTSVCNRISYQPLERQPFVFIIKKIMVASVIIFIAIRTGFPYVVAPPV